MMCMCKKCGRICGILFLIFGIIFLLQNLSIWDFWGIQWYTILFLLIGIGALGRCHCKECQCKDEKKK